MTGKAGRSNLQQRVLSAIVLVAVALLATWAGGIWYLLLCAAIAAAALYEWMSMSLAASEGAHRLLLTVLLWVPLGMMGIGFSGAVLLLALAGGVAIGMVHAMRRKLGFWPVAGLAYAGLTGISLASIRGDDAAGLVATLFLFAVVWATDILAYFTGRAVGGPKLAPSISPGKTWSGAIGGTVAAVIAGLGIAWWLGSPLGWGALFLLALALSIVSQGGDLFESSFKRRFNAKDSSQIIPGHGGVMDRVDGLAAAAFAMFAIGALTAGADAPAHAFFPR